MSELILPRLSVQSLGVDIPRWGDATRYPTYAAPPVLVLLVDENSCSDADTLAHAVKNLGIGSVVGHRTWGGVTTMYGKRLVDGSESFDACMPQKRDLTIDTECAVA